MKVAQVIFEGKELEGKLPPIVPNPFTDGSSLEEAQIIGILQIFAPSSLSLLIDARNAWGYDNFDVAVCVFENLYSYEIPEIRNDKIWNIGGTTIVVVEDRITYTVGDMLRGQELRISCRTAFIVLGTVEEEIGEVSDEFLGTDPSKYLATTPLWHHEFIPRLFTRIRPNH